MDRNASETPEDSSSGVLLLLEWLVITTVTIGWEERVKSREEIMDMLEAFDLTGSLRDAGELAGCSHHTVAACVAKRDEGRLPGVGPVRRERIIDPWLPKIEEWVERSCGKIRADRCHAKLKALGFEGSDRTVRESYAFGVSVMVVASMFGVLAGVVHLVWRPEWAGFLPFTAGCLVGAPALLPVLAVQERLALIVHENW